MSELGRKGRLQELADAVVCWKKHQVEVVLDPVENFTYVRAPGQFGGFEFVLLDTRGDIDALEEALTVLANQPTSEQRVIQQIWNLGAEFQDSPQDALTCIFETLGEYEHAVFLKRRDAKGGT